MANDDLKDDFDVFKGLKALSESSFPKRCGTCGRVFDSSDQYIQETKKIGSGTGLKASFDESDKPVLEVYRNCVCGSTLMDFFSDRRDLSEKGVRRRAIFQKVLDILKKHGIPVDIGRTEVLKFMRTGESELLQKFGIRGNVPSV